MKKPNWHIEIETFRLSANIMIVSGNILDCYIYPDNNNQIMNMADYLAKLFSDIGYESVSIYDNIGGFRGDSKSLTKLAAMIGVSKEELSAIPFQYSSNDTISACCAVKTVLSQGNISSAIIMDLASRYIPSPNSTRMEDINSFHVLTQAGRSGLSAKLKDGSPTHNLLVMIVDKENDLPAWFYMNNPTIRRITVERMSTDERIQYFNSGKFENIFDRSVYDNDLRQYASNPEKLEKIKNEMVIMTEGLMFSDIITISQLCRINRFHINEFSKAVNLFRYGVTSDNPWDKMNRETVAKVEDALLKNIIGQNAAINHTMDVIKRIVSGMSNLNSGNTNKPRGIMFFAGPTGTGKTETAKQIAKNLFLSQDALVTFDMSEYASENADQRLLGAPPGYVGYEAGGQLTNAVNKNPFSVFLFDEIEKASPKIMDKFLQILGEGRLTDGQGKTVYFNESIIIFTSNLGVYMPDPSDFTGKRKIPAFSPEDTYETIRNRVTKSIEQYFKSNLGRPELLNRIGDNIVVFNFIEDKNVRKILDLKIERIIQSMKQNKKINLFVAEEVRIKLVELCKETCKDKGGRGIENVIESALINPIARYMYDECISGGTLDVLSLCIDKNGSSTIICNHS